MLSGTRARFSVVTAAAAVGIAVVAITAGCSGSKGDDVTRRPASNVTAGPSPSVPPSSCPAAGGTLVKTAGTLKKALRTAKPGTVIRLADGVYLGTFTAKTAGTAAKPITVCGGPKAILDGGANDSGYVFHLDTSPYWQLVGFGVRNGQKGVVVDHSSHVLIQGLTVSQIGDEGIHLRAFSSDSRVTGNIVRQTGLRKPQFGEGIYIGSSKNNWGDLTGGKPDTSDRNTVENNDIAVTTAESIDIKEGTTGGVIRGNRFSGQGMSDADSWVDMKGNGWVVENNTGTTGPTDGYQVHVLLDGWGKNDTFRGNTGQLAGHGYAVNVDKKATGTVVACTNKIDGASLGISNIACR
jgi:hypothetical protein